MKHTTYFFYIFCCFFLFTNKTQAQKNIHILDAFYQALSQDSTDNISFDLEGGEFLMDSYPRQEVSPQKIIERYPDAEKYLINDSTFHIRGRFDIAGKIIDRGGIGDPKIGIKNIHFDYFEPNLTVVNPSAPNEIFYGSYLGFENVKAYTRIRSSGGGNIQFKIKDSYIKDLTLALVYPPTIVIRDSKLDLLLLALMDTDRVTVENCTIKSLRLQSVEADQVIFRNNIFDPVSSENPKILQDSSTYLRKTIIGHQPFWITAGVKKIDHIEFNNNHFKTSEQMPSFLMAAAGSTALITENTFDLDVLFANQTSSSFEMYNNKFTNVSLMGSLPSTPQNFVNISWKDLQGKLMWKRRNNDPIYFGKNGLELADKVNFGNLISSYGKLIEVYKNNRNTENANSVYLEMKDLEESRFSYVYKQEGGSDNLFRLKLHQLLSIYTEHGTNPAQAITASVWLMFLFGLIYFFFPSDWDEKSKPQLIADFKTLIQKNEHGYFIPFLKLSKGFLISMFNAFILSINSFVTLGFGRIPTHGVAKYICILEGFLGWFLLSIFIVSLINQVLF